MDITRPGTRPGLGPLVATALLITGALIALVAWSYLAGTAHDGTTGPDGSADVLSAPDVTTATDPSQPFAVWGFDHRGAPLRWDACAPVRLVLSGPDAPEHAERDLRTALAVLRDATGLDLQFTGMTDERPRVDRPLVADDGTGWRWRPVLVAWARPGEGDIPLTDIDRGVALPVAVRDGEREAYVTGQVVLNAARRDLVAGFADRRDAMGATLIHELAHLLGLAHVEDVSQLMATDPGSGPVELGIGDRAGLRAIGAEAGCNPAPRPEAGRGLVGPTRPAG